VRKTSRYSRSRCADPNRKRLWHRSAIHRAAVIAALLLGATTLPAVAATPTTRPTLRLAGIHPLLVRGTHFRTRERVRIVVDSAGQRLVRRTTATPAGAFTVSFGSVAMSRCEGISAYAVGARGSVAEVKQPPPPECAPE
jgi:hypothetical protein